jgi:membrane associated rhomboid family serine protease
MIIPIRTDYKLSRTPLVNYGIIAANAVIFLYTLSSAAASQLSDAYLLHPDDPQLYQFFTSVFLHANWMHLLGNMLFLWVFGNAVNDRFGNAGYLAFYLAGGVLAGTGYLLLGGHAPVLGASGAIAAVTGAYLVLFPRVRVTLLVLLVWVFVPWEVSSLLFLLFQFVFNLWMSFSPAWTGASAGGIAYAAHSSGYIFGIGLSALLLALRVLPREPYDLLGLLRHTARRESYRRSVADGYDPFDRGAGAKVSSRVVQQDVPRTISAQELELRKTVAAAFAQNNLPQAAQAYWHLLQIAPDAVLSRQQQLSVAHQLMSDQKYAAAAAAYELFLRHYGDYADSPDIYLMLGLIYGRYLNQYEPAEHYLLRALETLKDPGKVQMASTELQSLRQRRGLQ